MTGPEPAQTERELLDLTRLVDRLAVAMNERFTALERGVLRVLLLLIVTDLLLLVLLLVAIAARR